MYKKNTCKCSAVFLLVFSIVVFVIFIISCGEKVVKPKTHLDSDLSISESGSGFSSFHSDFGLQNYLPVSSNSHISESKKIQNDNLEKISYTDMSVKFNNHHTLLAYYAPIFIHYRAHRPKFDELCRIDYDSDFNTVNNVKKCDNFIRRAYIYSQVLGETEDSYYLLYVLYHLRDYDTSFREFFFSSSAHDNDLEGVILKVSKTEGVVAAETWYHSILLQFTIDKPTYCGLELIDGKLHLEDNQRPYILVQSRGHGVRAMQSLDLNSDEFNNAIIYRYAGTSETIESNRSIIGYDLLDFTEIFELALKGVPTTFCEYKPFLKSLIHLPLFLAGDFSGNSSWARPKPPWNWNSKLDELTGGALYFHPAYVFNRHFGFNSSTNYLQNIPMELIFGSNHTNMLDKMVIEADIWFKENHENYLGPKPSIFKKWYYAKKKSLGTLVQRLFFTLG